jgi:hypothetical protein
MEKKKILNLNRGPETPEAPSPQNLEIVIEHYDGVTGKTVKETITGEGIGVEHSLSQGPCLALVVEVFRDKGKPSGQRVQFFPYTFIRGLEIKVVG